MVGSGEGSNGASGFGFLTWSRIRNRHLARGNLNLPTRSAPACKLTFRLRPIIYMKVRAIGRSRGGLILESTEPVQG